jgi:ABC-2 type transport system permease protein
VLFTIVLNILDQIDALDPWRNAFPGHYNRAWQDIIALDPQWTAVTHGALWSLVWAVAFTMLGYRRFRRADILS